MLVERGVKDRYSIGFYLGLVNNGSTKKQECLHAQRPQAIRLRSIKLTCDSQGPAQATVWGLLVCCQDGDLPGDITLPSVTFPVWDMYEPAANIVWSWIGNVDYNNNTNVFDREWYGDGVTINMKWHDSLWFVARTDGEDCSVHGIAEFDIVA